MREDSLNFEINSGTITTQEAINIYLEIETKVIELMNKGQKSNMLDVYVKNTKFYYLQVLEQPIEGKPTPIGDFNGFTEPEYYYNADELITNAVNNHIKINTPYGFYTNLDTKEFILASENGGIDFRNYNSNLPYYKYYYLFYEISGIDPTGHNSEILTVDEMNFYYYGAYIAADIVKNYYNIDTEKRLKNIRLEDSSMPGNNNYPIMHFANFTYANFTPTSPNPNNR